MHALATGATKKQNVSRPGSQNASKIRPEIIRKSLSEASCPKVNLVRKHQFLLSQTHIGRLLDSTISSKNVLRNTARNALDKKLTKEHNKTLIGSILGGSGLKMCPKRLPIGVPSRFIFRTFSNFSQ